MILNEIYKHIDEIEDINKYHIETATIKSDDLNKTILRVTSDHNTDYGIRLYDKSHMLENGSVFKLSENNLLVINVMSEDIIVIMPKDINEMGVTAHLLGNLHKPIQVKDGMIYLMLDKVLLRTLETQNINYEIRKVTLDHPLKYIDLVK
ncbi:urease accessory protein UreE [Enterococcus faecium]|uniref:urease accessory protein UreE n=1 Tax=Enterococcus faecium TaxID=1352 RepID=UPI0006B2A8C7|nr:urease accessory protein UreE [Enterococcus faecium]